jgi:hypothetical protein
MRPLLPIWQIYSDDMRAALAESIRQRHQQRGIAIRSSAMRENQGFQSSTIIDRSGPNTEKGRLTGQPMLSFLKNWSCRLWSKNILGLQSLRSLLHLELHLQAFFQRSVTAHLNRCEVNKNVIAVGALDESITLGGVKPFHGTFFSHV